MQDVISLTKTSYKLQNEKNYERHKERISIIAQAKHPIKLRILRAIMKHIK